MPPAASCADRRAAAGRRESSTTSATAATTGRGSAACHATRALSCTACAPPSAWAAPARARSCRAGWPSSRSCPAVVSLAITAAWRRGALAVHATTTTSGSMQAMLVTSSSPPRRPSSSRGTCATACCRSTSARPLRADRLRRRQARRDGGGAPVLMARAAARALLRPRSLAATDLGTGVGDEVGRCRCVIAAPLDPRPRCWPRSGLAIAAFTPRRAYATGAIIAVFIVHQARSPGSRRGCRAATCATSVSLVNPFVAGRRRADAGCSAAPIAADRPPRRAADCHASARYADRGARRAGRRHRCSLVCATGSAVVAMAIELDAGLALVRQRGRRQRRHDDHRPRRHRPARPERRRQVHAAAHDGRLPGPVGAAPSPLDGAADLAQPGRSTARSAWSPSARRCTASSPAGEFVLASARLHGLPDPDAAAARGARAWSRWTDAAGPRGSRPTPRACGSGSRWPPRSSTTRRCCCSTSRSTAWTRASGCT